MNRTYWLSCGLSNGAAITLASVGLVQLLRGDHYAMLFVAASLLITMTRILLDRGSDEGDE